MMMNKTEPLIEKAQKYIMPTYSRFPIAFEKGKGCVLTDVDGKEYLDFVGGIAVNALGYGDEGLTQTIADQAAKMIHVSNLYWTEPQIEAAQLLVEGSGLDQVFFCNSGAEANEAAMKLARISAKHRKSQEAVEIIAMDHSFHGRTYAAITATGQPKYQKDLDPLMPGILHVPFNDLDALKTAVSSKTCAILMEPIQGEGGIYPAESAYLQAVRQLCDDQKIALIFDEVQCGIGRTGALFAFQNYGVTPDIVCFAKGVAGGVPMGGILAKKEVAAYFTPGTHASTFGGNPLATAASAYVLKRILAPGFLDDVKRKGALLEEKLKALQKEYPQCVDVRGMGLMMGLELSVSAGAVVKKAIENGLLLVAAGPNVVRFVPPLVVSDEEISQAVKIITRCL
jgi:acetylornithine/N-succinyldiaminopimelate aminotransferase